MKKLTKFSMLFASLALVMGAGLVGEDVKSVSAESVELNSSYTKITNCADLANGDKVVLYSPDAAKGVTGWNAKKDATVSANEADWVKYEVQEASATTFALYDSDVEMYVGTPGTSNQFVYSTSSFGCTVDPTGVLLAGGRYLCENGTFYRMYTNYGSFNPFYVYKVAESSSTEPSVQINEGEKEIGIGESVTFTATVKNADGVTVNWSVDSDTVGTIDQDGKFTGTAEGEAVVTAKISVNGVDYTSTVNVTVIEILAPEIKVASIADLASKTAADNTVVEVKGKVANIVNTSYGNFDLVDLNDPTVSIYVYGATKDSSKLTLADSKKGYYTGKWSSGQNFNDACYEDDVITMHVVVAVYKGKSQIQGVITEVVSAADAFINDWKAMRAANNNSLCEAILNHKEDVIELLNRYDAFSNEQKELIDAAMDLNCTIGVSVAYANNVIHNGAKTDADLGLSSGVLIKTNNAKTSKAAVLAVSALVLLSFGGFVVLKKFRKAK